MKPIYSLLTALVLGVSTLLPFASVTADTELPLVKGEVKKVKPDSGKITIKHEEIPNLDMPGMTMVFRTEEDADISRFKKGDQVQFTVIEKDGKYFIVNIDSSE